MIHTLAVTTPASDLQLLTIEEMRAAAGVTDSSQDTALQAHGLKISAAITAECNIAVGSGGDPTLWKETLTETFRCVEVDRLVLSRRHNIEVSSVVVDSTIYDAADYEADSESGLLYRFCNDVPHHWRGRKIVVVYDAGFETIPSDLKMAATDFFRLAWLEQGRDPSKKRDEVDIPGVAHTVTDYWVGSIPGQSSEGAVPDIVAGQLQRYRNIIV